ncbi:unnamed protein product [Fusarium fujikuroi]|uniref:F-box domain-containing protein n=1 Tax=Fusarium fujikuroi TaxID=5127 RepID=A0A9Q9RW38_FUSFU|nr:uncharacterized protein FFE2_04872 [Fusarium fujikuroi]SCV35337.1 uncharacterized protein FFFS_04689 [Fusarium fujikuroi]VTT63478.1 unnamed protein product [Fusarium fujikuroi]VTT73794.1 unnamed protein product [Fusarium fujikuroi]VZI04231.1 unnamed protein product [Fusarium fujikuroi]
MAARNGPSQDLKIALVAIDDLRYNGCVALADNASFYHLAGLPSELHTEIVKNLSFPDNANLKGTCKYFQDLIKFRHAEQIEAETSPFAMIKNVYAWLAANAYGPPSPMFMDNMLWAKRRKGGVEASKRC